MTTMKKQTKNKSVWNIGKNYFIRTATYHLTGKLEYVGEQELVLSSACWIADSGRFMQAIATSEFSEVEPFPKNKNVIVGRGAIIDAVQIDKLPVTQK